MTCDSIHVCLKKKRIFCRRSPVNCLPTGESWRPLSRARGDFRGDSDFDVLIVVDEKSRELKNKIIDIFYMYELATDISFSLTIRSQEELKFHERLGSPFLNSIKKEGIIFYDSRQRREEDALKVST